MEQENYIQRISELAKPSAAFKTYLNGVTTEYSFGKNTNIAIEELTGISAQMIQSGMVRLVYIMEDTGEENTLYLYIAGSFIPEAELGVYLKGSLYLYFLEDTILQGISREFLPIIYRVFPEYISLREKINAIVIGKLLLHLAALSGTKSDQRYEYLENNHRRIQRTVVQKYIANFLGMDIKTYSRLRASGVKK